MRAVRACPIIPTLILVGLLSACGADSVTPTQPSPPGLQIHAGTALFSMTGFGISYSPDFPPCTYVRNTPLGFVDTEVDSVVNLRQEGLEWVATPVSPDGGNLVLRFHQISSTSSHPPEASPHFRPNA
jgi:hypothetical protein